MSQTITVRVTKELGAWLEETAKRTGMSQSRIIREQLQQARAARPGRAFMRLAGTVRGAANLSQRRGFSRS